MLGSYRKNFGLDSLHGFDVGLTAGMTCKRFFLGMFLSVRNLAISDDTLDYSN